MPTQAKPANQWAGTVRCIVWTCRATQESAPLAVAAGWEQDEPDHYDEKPCIWRCPKHRRNEVDMPSASRRTG